MNFSLLLKELREAITFRSLGSWTRKEVVREDCQARKLNKEDAVDRCKLRKVIKEVR